MSFRNLEKRFRNFMDEYWVVILGLCFIVYWIACMVEKYTDFGA